MSIKVNGTTLTSVKVGSTTVHKVNVITNSSTGAYVTVFDDNSGTVTYTVRFYDGSSFLTSETVESEQKIKTTTYSKNGYTFNGWYTDSTLKTSFNNSTAITSNLDLYGKWTNSGSGGGTVTPTTYPDFSDYDTSRFCITDYNGLISAVDDLNDSEDLIYRNNLLIENIIPIFNSRTIFLAKAKPFMAYNNDAFEENFNISINSNGGLVHSENIAFPEQTKISLEHNKYADFNSIQDLLSDVIGCRKDTPFYSTIYELCFEPLRHYGEDGSYYVKDFVTMISVSDDYTSCTINLNPDINYDSDCCLAPSYVNFFDLEKLTSFGCNFKNQYYERIYDIVTAEASDDYTLILTCKDGFKLSEEQWNELLSDVISIPNELIDAGNEQCLGPYYIASYESDESELLLYPNENNIYYNKDTVQVKLYTNLVYGFEDKAVSDIITGEQTIYIGFDGGEELEDIESHLTYNENYNRCYYLTIDDLEDPYPLYYTHAEFLTAIEAACCKDRFKNNYRQFINSVPINNNIYSYLPDSFLDYLNFNNPNIAKYIPYNISLLKYFQESGGYTNYNGYFIGNYKCEIKNLREELFNLGLKYTNLTSFLDTMPTLPYLTVTYYQFECHDWPIDLGLVKNNSYHIINKL